MNTDEPGRSLSLSEEGEYSLLEAAAVRLDVRIRLENLREEEDLNRPRGGLIRLGRERIVILDKNMPLKERIPILARALNRALKDRGEESGYLPPAVRRILAESEERSPD